MSHKTIFDSSYVHPEVLVDTEWLEHLYESKGVKPDKEVILL